MPKGYRIKRWKESAESLRLKRLPWLRVETSPKYYLDILVKNPHPNRDAQFGVWIALNLLSAVAPHDFRGLLVESELNARGEVVPHDAASIAREFPFSKETIEQTIARAVEVGLLEEVEVGNDSQRNT